MAFKRSIWQLTNRFTRQLPLVLAIAAVCNGSVQAEDTSSSYCLNAGAENDFNCSKANAVNTNQADIDSKLSELTQWLEDEELVLNGESTLTQGQALKHNGGLQQKIDFNAQLLADELKKAQALQSQGNYGAAFTEVDDYLASHPKDPNGWLLYGIALMDQNKLSAAENVFSKLIKLYPNAPEPYNNLAAIYARQGDNNKAVNTLLEAFNTHPSYALVQQNLKAVYASLATQAYNRALDLDESVNAPRPTLAILNQVYQQQAIPDSTPKVTMEPASSKPVAETQPKQILASQKPISNNLVIEERKVDEGIVPPYQEEFAASVSPASSQANAANSPAIQTVSRQEKLPKSEANSAGNQAKATQSVASLVELNDEAAQEINTLLNQWAAAWSAQDVEQYVAFYSNQYQPNNKISHNQWKWGRNKRLKAPEYIQVTISDISIVALPDGRIRTVFMQEYKSNTFEDEVYKTLILSPQGAGWKITLEKTL